MIDFSKRSTQKEILDSQNIPFADIQQNMKELDFINTYLGGHAITIQGFKKLAGSKKTISVCEAGCGGGDNLNALHNYCNKKNITLNFIGIDINGDCIAFAKKHTGLPDENFIISDYSKVDFADNKPDVIFTSLFCHHFTDEQLITMMRWMIVNSKTGFYINDLNRHPIAYQFIKFATKFFSKSYLVKNDAPISVLRGFKKVEWVNILDKAGIKNYTIQWKWAFRHLVIVQNEQ